MNPDDFTTNLFPISVKEFIVSSNSKLVSFRITTVTFDYPFIYNGDRFVSGI